MYHQPLMFSYVFSPLLGCTNYRGETRQISLLKYTKSTSMAKANIRTPRSMTVVLPGLQIRFSNCPRWESIKGVFSRTSRGRGDLNLFLLHFSKNYKEDLFVIFKSNETNTWITLKLVIFYIFNAGSAQK